ncbi:MAG: site-specific integrase [Planctomycetes bacterium]|nr:site-specific integrase [Planctomycetota bacterium]MBI3833367.1 site-specific integrase [Planctomycetota bacterium]
MAKARQRIPKLRFTSWRKLGWHVAFRDATTGSPRKHVFKIRGREREAEARVLYHAWVLEHIGGNGNPAHPTQAKAIGRRKPSNNLLSGSLLEIASGLIAVERGRARKDGESRRRGTIDRRVFSDRKKQIRDFLGFLNERHGAGAVSKMQLADLAMDDVEAYNQFIAGKGYSASQVAKRIGVIKAIIDRAGRPEHGGQVLGWNWDSRDVAHGVPTEERALPSVKQLRRLLRATDNRGRTMIWLGIGLGLGARDIAAIRVGQIARESYDLRRGKTGVERYGGTPQLVWLYVSRLQAERRRAAGELLFVTRNGLPVVHGASNAVTQWWEKLRERVAKKNEAICSFYTLRHLGATEFGCRPNTSISDVKRWLGHSASSRMADVYMRPVRPEYRELVEWVRRKLNTKFGGGERGH